MVALDHGMRNRCYGRTILLLFGWTLGCSSSSNGAGGVDAGKHTGPDAATEAATSEAGTVQCPGPDASAGFPAGIKAGPVTSGVPSKCSGAVYVPVPSSACPCIPCPGPTSYAICFDGTFSACSCTMPPSYVSPMH
jgi:hypothetical protein